MFNATLINLVIPLPLVVPAGTLKLLEVLFELSYPISTHGSISKNYYGRIKLYEASRFIYELTLTPSTSTPSATSDSLSRRKAPPLGSDPRLISSPGYPSTLTSASRTYFKSNVELNWY